MALNMNDKLSLAQNILPEVDFNATSLGITVSGHRFSTPRFIPFEHGGKCKECKSTEVEIDFIVTKEGVTIYCNRFKGQRFVAFDLVYELPNHCFFRVCSKIYIYYIKYLFRLKTKEEFLMCHMATCTRQ